MSAQNVYGVLGEVQRDIFGHETSYASVRNGYGASEIYHGNEASFDEKELWINGGADAELMALLYEYSIAGSHDPEADAYAEKVTQVAQALQIRRQNGSAFTGNTDYEIQATAEVLIDANPEADPEEVMNLVSEVVNLITESRRAQVEFATGTTGSHQAPELRLATLA